MKVAERKI